MKALGRTVLARNRHARILGLGDRRSPSSETPAMVMIEGDPESFRPLCVLHFERDASKSPAHLSMKTLNSAYDVSDAPSIIQWEVEEGLHLPPSLNDADSGRSGGDSEFLLLSWQSLHHDSRLSNSDLRPDIVVLVDAPQLSSSGADLIIAIRTLRERFPAALLWTPGLGGPDNAALLAWMGVDLFDSSRSRFAASHGHLLTMLGPRPFHESESEDRWIQEWRDVSHSIRSAIRSGTLRELVEMQVLNSASSVEHLRRFDALLRDDAAPLDRFVSSTRKFRFNAVTSRQDPLVHDWRRRVSEDYTPPPHSSRILLLLPCSERKPYRESQSHRRFARHIQSNGVDQVMVTSPLGLVPRALEDIWPAAHYDIPVTGDWDLDELEMIHSMVAQLVERVGYEMIIDHSGMNLQSRFPNLDVIDTRQGRTAGNPESLEYLESTINKLVSEFEIRAPKGHRHRIECYRSLSRFQYGTDAWLEDVRIEGRPPKWRLQKNGAQIAQWHPDAGRFAFSKSALPILHDTKTLPEIEIKSGIDWRGDIFSTILSNYPKGIRVGDDLLVMQDGNLIGSARATAPYWEWMGSPGRLARSHHRLG
ncbi:MAG: hypothetical protein CL981_05630 [Euryarchaeota archaeon]|nr:hypothetical protein [Euryarchaeota archaeon]